MKRATATALALVNWRGVFYERYLLDRHVTALEGANGAGKTTVMIGAYVVLLPDMSRLRFTNLGESAATGGDKGIWGRLGDEGTGSYAAMEIALPDGARLVAGVRLQRRSEPQVELTPFVVEGVDLGGSFKELLLVSGDDHDSVPSLDQLKTACDKLGATLHVCGSAKEYFAILFDRGVTPLRLATDDERSRLADMLRTSMTGGISRALTSELRSFLLREESTLFDTLSRMHENLDACRKTRVEVSAARALEQEISAVHEAGLAMLAHSLTAARAAGDETARAAMRAEDDARRTREQHTQCGDEIRDLEEELGANTARLARARDDAREAEALLARSDVVHALESRLATLRRERADAHSRAAARQLARDEAEAARADARARVKAMRADLGRSAQGLCDRQAGLDAAHQRAHDRGRAERALVAARLALGVEELGVESIPSTLASLRPQLAELDGAHARARAAAASRAAAALERTEALAALERLEAGAADDTGATLHQRARLALAAHRDREALAAVRAERVAQWEAACLDLEHATAAERLLSDLDQDVPRGSGDAPPDEQGGSIERARAEASARVAALAREEHEATFGAERAAGLAAACEARFAAWSAIECAREQLDGAEVPDVAAVAALQRSLGERLATVRSEQVARESAAAQSLAEASRLETVTLAAEDGLGELCDALDATPLHARCEQASVEEARHLEAVLGGLGDVLVVRDARAAADEARKLLPPDSSVAFVSEATVDALLAAAGALDLSAGREVVIEELHGVRVARLAEEPMLARASRAKRAAGPPRARRGARGAVGGGEPRARAHRGRSRGVDDAPHERRHAGRWRSEAARRCPARGRGSRARARFDGTQRALARHARGGSLAGGESEARARRTCRFASTAE
jgi:chromosome partition protein MukB